jgi:hypothetical protein
VADVDGVVAMHLDAGVGSGVLVADEAVSGRHTGEASPRGYRSQMSTSTAPVPPGPQSEPDPHPSAPPSDDPGAQQDPGDE